MRMRRWCFLIACIAVFLSTMTGSSMAAEKVRPKLREIPAVGNRDIITLDNDAQFAGVILREGDGVIEFLVEAPSGRVHRTKIPLARIRKIEGLETERREIVRSELEAIHVEQKHVDRQRVVESQRVQDAVRNRIAQQRAVAAKEAQHRAEILAAQARAHAKENAERVRKDTEQIRRNMETYNRIQRDRAEQMRRGAEARARIESERAWANYLRQRAWRLNNPHTH